MTYGFGSGTPDPLVLNDGTFTNLTATGSFTSPGIDDNATSAAVTIDSSGNLLVGVTSGSNHIIYRDVVKDTGSVVLSSGDAGTPTILIYGVSGTGYNAANAAVKLAADGLTSRSINAAGTVNASGTDYAEYEYKADGCGDFAKGDIVGFNAEGKLTDAYADAVSFAIKSTNPSYVGGDTWHDGLERPEQPVYIAPEYTGVEPSPTDEEGNVLDEAQQAQYEADQASHAEAVAAAQDAHAEAMTQWQADLATFEAELEVKRQRVDRIAYAGKVPVNGIDGATPGHKVIAVDDGNGGITCIAKASPTLEEYMNTCVGTVRANGVDGRAIVEVKMG